MVIIPLPTKLEAFKELKETTNEEVQTILGICGYYYRFKLCYADMFLTKKGFTIELTVQFQLYFDTLIRSLSEPPIVIHPNSNDTYYLHTDASKYAWGMY